MKNDAVAYGDVVAEVDSKFFFHAVEDAVVLDVGIVADANLMDVAAKDGVHPNAGVLAEHDVADELGRVVYVAGVGELGSDALVGSDHNSSNHNRISFIRCRGHWFGLSRYNSGAEVKRMRLRFLSILLGIALLTQLGTAQAASPAQGSSRSGSPELSKFFATYFEDRLRDEPEFATTVGRHEYDDRWTDLSKQARDQRRARLEQTLAEAEKLSGAQDAVSPQDQLSVKLLRYDLRTQLDAFDLQNYLLRVGQMTGFHNTVYLVIDRMPSFTVKDCENIIARLRATPAYVDQNIAILDEAIARGMTQPKIVSDLVIEQLTAQAGQDASTTPLLFFLKKMPSEHSGGGTGTVAQGGDGGFRK